MIPTGLFEASKYYFNPHAVPLFISVVLIALLGMKAVASRRSKTNLHFGVVCLSTVIWLFFTAIGYLVREDKELATFWFRLDWVGVAYISISVYAFVVHFLEKKRALAIKIGYTLASFFAAITLISNPMMIGVRKYSWGFFALREYRWSPIFFIFFFSYMVAAFCELIVAYRQTSDAIKRNHIKYVILAFTIAYLGTVDFLPTYGIRVYPWGFAAISMFAAITSYAILRHHLMDINIVIRKTLLYSVISAALASVYVGTITLLAQVLGAGHGSAAVFSSAVAAILITLLFNPLRIRTQRWIDRQFPHEHLDPDLLQETAGNFAHEMKRPLSKISLPAQLVLMELRSVKKGEKSLEEVMPTVEQRLQFIIDQSVEAGYVIEAIRELSTSAVPFEPVDLRLVVDRALSVNKDLLEKHEISTRLHLPESLRSVPGRDKQLEIIFVNLIKNAAEAMRDLPAGKKRELRIEGQSDHAHVVIRVADTGPGIKSEDTEKLFSARYSTKGQSGTGLGLYLSRQIIETHKGSIEVSSRPAQGSEFIIRLLAVK